MEALACGGNLWKKGNGKNGNWEIWQRKMGQQGIFGNEKGYSWETKATWN